MLPTAFDLHQHEAAVHKRHDQGNFRSSSTPKQLKRTAASIDYCSDDEADQAVTPTTAWQHPAKRIRTQQQDDNGSDCWNPEDGDCSDDDSIGNEFRGTTADADSFKDGGAAAHWACSPSLDCGGGEPEASSMQAGSTFLSFRQMQQQNQQSPSVQRSLGPLNTPTASLVQLSSWNDEELISKAVQPPAAAPAAAHRHETDHHEQPTPASFPSYASRLAEAEAAAAEVLLTYQPELPAPPAPGRRLQVQETHVTMQQGNIFTEIFRRTINYIPEEYNCNSDPEE